MISAEDLVLAGWIAMLLGVVSGAVIGLFFHQRDWAGGYASFRRRLMRLGHISFFGLGLLNVAFGLTWQSTPLAPDPAAIASVGFLTGLITMPACCFLAAWRKPFRHAFAVPVVSVLVGITALLAGWPSS